MTYKLVPYSESIDLTEFYLQAESKGFKNNSNKKMLVDSISTEKNGKFGCLNTTIK